jgi:hypothetical protein
VAGSFGREALYDFLEPNRPRTAAERAEKAKARLKYRRSAPGEAGLLFEQWCVLVDAGAHMLAYVRIGG